MEGCWKLWNLNISSRRNISWNRWPTSPKVFYFAVLHINGLLGSQELMYVMGDVAEIFYCGEVPQIPIIFASCRVPSSFTVGILLNCYELTSNSSFPHGRNLEIPLWERKNIYELQTSNLLWTPNTSYFPLLETKKKLMVDLEARNPAWDCTFQHVRNGLPLEVWLAIHNTNQFTIYVAQANG